MRKSVLITAAGLGSRFQAAGYTPPKPLIQAAGRTLLEHVLDGLKWTPGDACAVAYLREHHLPQQLNLSSWAQQAGVDLRWVPIEELCNGQLLTAHEALRQLQWDGVIWIHNCDTGFRWGSALDTALTTPEAFAAMPVFEAEGEHWSFGQPDPAAPQWALQIAEKRRISPLASIGLYGFRDGAGLPAAIDTYLRQAALATSGLAEYYIAPFLQWQLEQGRRISLPPVHGVRLFGTPQELERTFADQGQDTP